MATTLRGKGNKRNAPAKNGPAKWVGQPIRRKEEDRLVRGKGIFVDDQKLMGMLHIRFVRSSYGHAKIARLDVSKAATLPGVVCTLTGAEALKDASLVHPEMGTNRNWHGVFEYGKVEKAFKQAAHVVHIGRLHFHRFSSTPLENNAMIAVWDSRSERIEYWSNNSFPSFAAQFLSPALGVGIDQILMKSFDIGGGFGIKITNYPYMAVCALASRKTGGRPVKWAETRTEHMQASAHGNERTFLDTRVGLDKNGVITAIASRHVDDCGAYPRYEPLGCVIWAQVLPGAYRVKNVRIDMNQVVTNKCPVGPNRGYSRMQHLWFMERVLDICGHTLRISTDEMRVRNYIRKEEMPYTTPNGCVYDSGDYAGLVE